MQGQNGTEEFPAYGLHSDQLDSKTSRVVTENVSSAAGESKAYHILRMKGQFVGVELR